VEDAPVVENKPHSVARATWLSAALPGAGQAYNKKYWKMPIVYAGLGVCGYLAIENNRQYRTYLNAFYKRIDSTQTDQFEGIYEDPSQLIVLQNIYRKWRDLSLIIGGVIYALQIIDAHVDAHLYYYDIDDNLSLKFEPSLMPGFGNVPAVGFSLSLQFKWK